MIRTTFYQLVAPTGWLFCISLLLCCINYVLFVAVTKLQKDSCKSLNTDLLDVSDEIPRSKLHWNVFEKNEAWLVEIAKYKTFDWKKEMDRLLQIIPVLEFRTNTSITDDTDPFETLQDDEKAPPIQICDDKKWSKLPYASDKVQMDKIVQEIRRINRQFGTLHKYENGIEASLWVTLREEVFPNGMLLCDGLAKLEKSRANPRIRYDFRSSTQYKGYLRTDSVDKFPIKLRRTQRDMAPRYKPYKADYVVAARRNQVPYLDKKFEHAKNELLSLLKMQGWYGIPRLLGVCAMTSDGQDVVESSMNGGKSPEPQQLRYMIARHEDSFTKICDDYIPSFQCLQGYPVVGSIKVSENPTENALRFMLNIARMFSQFQEKGVTVNNIVGEDFAFNKNFDVLMTGFSTVHFLANNEESKQTSNGFERPLSGTICQMDRECVQASWQSNSLSSKFGRRCQETEGYCTSENRCWGLDSTTHVCILSRWLFSPIQAAVWPQWAYARNLTDVIRCATLISPEHRCSWSDIQSMLEELQRT